MLRKRRLALSALGFELCVADDEPTPKQKRVWVKPWIDRRVKLGYHQNLIKELCLEDHYQYRRLLRMDAPTFGSLVKTIEPLIGKQDTIMRQAISVEERLEITLRYLATGESYSSLHYQFRVGRSTISSIVESTCDALYRSLRDNYLVFPKTADEWKSIAKEFYDTWQFPNCLGAIDGKHVVIQPPPNSGSYYYNYKHSHSIVLLALVNSDLQFIYVDVGTNGRISDGGVWGKSSLKQALDQGQLNIPSPTPLPFDQTGEPFPYVFVGDAAFGLSKSLMRPYSARQMSTECLIYNYRLSRCRRVVENAFGVLSNRFQVFRSPIRLEPDKVVKVVLATCALHNLLRSKPCTRSSYSPEVGLDREDTSNGTILRGVWSEGKQNSVLMSLARTGSNSGNCAKALRDKLCVYFSGDGAVQWQLNMI